MHFNENFGRAQAITKSGTERIKLVYPKQKQGEYTPKIVPIPQIFSKKVHKFTYSSYMWYLLFQ